MPLTWIEGKRWILLLVLSSGCQTWQPFRTFPAHSWVIEEGRAYCMAEALCPSMMLEMVKREKETRIYLNLFSFYVEEEQQVELLLISDRDQLVDYPDCFLGGQRLLLSKKAGEWIIDHLKQKQNILCDIGGRKQRFLANGSERIQG